MYKLLALYAPPDDPAAFEAHYREVHVPLARAIPGLERLVLNRVQGTPMGGEAPYHLVAELHFPDKETFKAAAQSPEFQATGADLANFAKGRVTLLVVEEEAD